MYVGTHTLERIAQMDRFNAWMAENIRPHVGNRILEVGAGIGNMTQHFLDREYVLATDSDDQLLLALQERLGARSNLRTRRLDLLENPDAITSERFDTIVCLNVLEHIEDDRKALRNMFHILEPGGKLVLLVPAFQWLFGSMDVGLGHYRRYTRKELREKFIATGFDIVSVRWMNMFGMIGWFLNGRLRKVEALPEGQLRAYDRFVPFFRLVERLTGPPIGQSIIVVGKKPR
jgi:SAM-dependent methyltransferase